MMTLALRTDAPVAELYVYQDMTLMAKDTWEAHRALSDTILARIHFLLESVNCSYTQVQKVIVYEGPGSFTGLRIGHSVANAFAYSLGISVVATSGDDWLSKGLETSAGLFTPVAPFYGADAHITQPKK